MLLVQYVFCFFLSRYKSHWINNPVGIFPVDNGWFQNDQCFQSFIVEVEYFHQLYDFITGKVWLACGFSEYFQTFVFERLVFYLLIQFLKPCLIVCRISQRRSFFNRSRRTDSYRRVGRRGGSSCVWIEWNDFIVLKIEQNGCYCSAEVYLILKSATKPFNVLLACTCPLLLN